MKTKRAHETSPALALAPQQALWLDLMQFYIREAWLLDERRLKEWLQLFTDDGVFASRRSGDVRSRRARRAFGPKDSTTLLANLMDEIDFCNTVLTALFSRTASNQRQNAAAR